MSTFVLVPGSCLGAWAWNRVTPLLRAAGHEVHPLTLTGFGDRAHLVTPQTDLATHVQDVVAVLETEELSDVVLVGHSYAGAVVGGAAERAAGRIARLVLLAGTLPVDGASLFDVAGPEFRTAIEKVAATRGGGWGVPFFSDEELDRYWGDHELTAEDLRWIRAHAAPQPLATFRSVQRIGDPAAAALPRTYVRCTHDPAPPPVLPGDAGWEHAELDTGHWPMVTRPAELTRLLGAIAEGGA
jgi:pimeloyl-ACP methyl ester carboxylesterase